MDRRVRSGSSALRLQDLWRASRFVSGSVHAARSRDAPTKLLELGCSARRVEVLLGRAAAQTGLLHPVTCSACSLSTNFCTSATASPLADPPNEIACAYGPRASLVGVWFLDCLALFAFFGAFSRHTHHMRTQAAGHETPGLGLEVLGRCVHGPRGGPGPVSTCVGGIIVTP